MHTLIVLAIGIGLLGLSALVGWIFRGPPGAATAALVFLPLWFIGAGINMYIGVTRAGYSIGAETPIFLVVFGIPAAAAILAWSKLH